MKGLDSHGMDDKWLIHYQEPELFFHRSWTGRPVYRLTLEATPNGAQVIEALWAKDFSDASKWGLDYEVALLDFLVSNLLLGEPKSFPVPPGLTDSMAGPLQHNISGTGFGARAFSTSTGATRRNKPWWRFW
jgi:hypothetical protein